MSRPVRPLEELWKPRTFTFVLPQAAERVIGTAEDELVRWATQDQDKCCGYFPDSPFTINQDLPDSQALARSLPCLRQSPLMLGFNFLRLSLQPQPRIHPWHIDTDAATAVSGSLDRTKNVAVWRALLNLSTKDIRRIDYLALDPGSVTLQENEGRGYVSLESDMYDMQYAQAINLAPRVGRIIEGAVFCASQVLHRGNDGDSGHFVAGFGQELEVAA